MHANASDRGASEAVIRSILRNVILAKRLEHIFTHLLFECSRTELRADAVEILAVLFSNCVDPQNTECNAALRCLECAVAHRLCVFIMLVGQLAAESSLSEKERKKSETRWRKQHALNILRYLFYVSSIDSLRNM